MTPSNTPITPEIENIADNQGNKHTVIPSDHGHSISEIEGLASALAGKADTTHTHRLIQYNTSSTDGFAGFTVTGAGSFTIQVQADKSIDFQFGPTVKASITNSNVDNLARALRNPDTTPTANSTNIVTSGGVKAAIEAHIPAAIEDEPEPGKHASMYIAPTGAIAAVTGVGFGIAITQQSGDPKMFEVSNTTIENLQRASQDPDTTPTTNSDKLVTSGGVKAALDGKAPAGDTEVIFDEGENLFVYLPSYFTNGERQRSFILDYQGEAKALIDIFGCDTYDMIRILSHDDSTIMVEQCYIAVRVIKQPGGVEQGDVYYIIFDGKNDY